MRGSMKKISAVSEIDMTEGPILKNMIRFVIPLMASILLQLLYNAADMVIVGQFAGSAALAAVGATSMLITLLVNLFLGFSVGANVIVAQYLGAGQQKQVEESVHTAVLMALLSGIGTGLVGIILARPLLVMMNTPADILDSAVLYITIYFCGMPAVLLYDFCAAILRAVGDTKRPLYYLTVSGILNVLLNLLFVIVFSMDVAGVALATVISQLVSMVLIIRCLLRMEGSVRLNPRRLHLHRDKVRQIMKIGLPAGLQSAMFSISNLIIQSSINSFGAAAIAGNTIAANIEGFVSTPLSAYFQAATSFSSQAYGAGKPERIGKIGKCAAGLLIAEGFVTGLLAACFARPLLGIYTSDPAVIEWGLIRMWMLVTTCFIADTGDVFVSCLRGMGNSLMPMLLSILCTCGFRILWIAAVFAAFPTEVMLYLCYPLSWTLATAVHFSYYMWYKKKVIAAEGTGEGRIL